VNIDWYFEKGVCSSATNKKQCSNAQRSHIKDNYPSTTQEIAKSVVDIGLACSSWPMQKECLSGLVLNSLHDFVKC
jgi:hypothetical protein